MSPIRALAAAAFAAALTAAPASAQLSPSFLGGSVGYASRPVVGVSAAGFVGWESRLFRLSAGADAVVQTTRRQELYGRDAFSGGCRETQTGADAAEEWCGGRLLMGGHAEALLRVPGTAFAFGPGVRVGTSVQPYATVTLDSRLGEGTRDLLQYRLSAGPGLFQLDLGMVIRM